jgi:TrmH family RNA methyltransferase
VLEGLRLCLDVQRSGLAPEECYFTKTALEKYPDEAAALCSLAERSFEIDDACASKISDTAAPQGVFCLMNAIDKTTSSYKIDFKGKYIMLENVQDPSNLGACARSAEAFGLSALLLYNCCDTFNPKALRASMGALLRIPCIDVTSVPELLQQCSKNNMKTYASVPDRSALSITKADLCGGVLCVVGNEARGVTEDTQNRCDDRLTIPMSGRAESLNASAAASVIMWEMVKDLIG